MKWTRGLAVIAAGLLPLLAWLVYLPGLQGGFHFDDYINLDLLAYVRADDFDSVLLYLASGTADPLGRPLSLLSFLANLGDWPDNPAGFLRFNLCLHLANGLLLYALLSRLGAWLGDEEPRRGFAALLGAALWLLHPLFVSTTLYAVQREAMLPASFVMLGLLAYSRGRRLCLEGATRKGAAWMVAGIGFGTLLAALGKANGLLLPILAWVLEATVFASADRRSQPPAQNAQVLRRWRIALLVLPSLLVLAYLGRYLLALHEDWGRPYTIGERLLSQPRALLDYLGLLLAPRAVTGGLYNDDFQASTGWLQPWTTLPSVLVVLLLLVLPFALRRRAPALSAALGFYFGAQLLESSVVPLELYFEHRNYLPALLFFWPLARWLCAWRAPVVLRVAAASLLVVLCAATTWQRASLWGDPARVTALWLVHNPASSRAVATMAISLRQHGQPEQAMRLLGNAWAQAPGDVQLAMNVAETRCAIGGMRPVDLRLVGRSLGLATHDADVAWRWLDSAHDMVRAGSCPGLDDAGIEGLAQALEANPAFDSPARTQNLESLRGRIAIARQQPEQAASHFRRSLEADVRPEVAASQAVMLGEAGYHAQAMAHLDLYDHIASRAQAPAAGMPQVRDWLVRRQQKWPREFAVIRAQLRAEK